MRTQAQDTPERMRIVSGQITGSTGVGRGTGFVSSKVAAGITQIRFTPPFRGKPIIKLTCESTILFVAMVNAPTTDLMEIRTFTAGGATQDNVDYHFEARGLA